MKRVNWPVWALCVVIFSVGFGCLAIGFMLRFSTPDEKSKSKILAVQAMASAFDMIKESRQVETPQTFTVTRPFSNSGEVAGFVIQPLKATTYLVQSDDKKILLLLQQQADGTDKKCLMHPPEIKVGDCLLGE